MSDSLGFENMVNGIVTDPGHAERMARMGRRSLPRIPGMTQAQVDALEDLAEVAFASPEGHARGLGFYIITDAAVMEGIANGMEPPPVAPCLIHPDGRVAHLYRDPEHRA